MSKRPAFAARRASHLRLGRRGERIAARLLVELGFDVLARNYSGHAGEVDIVARDGDVLCFVEVKTRRRAVRAMPAEAVGRAKRERLIRISHQYLRELGRPPIRHRFDVVEVVVDGWRVRHARHLPGAFTEADGRVPR